MKKLLLVFISILLLIGCTDVDMGGNGSVNVSINKAARGISSVDMNAAKYVVTATNTAKSWTDTLELKGTTTGTFASVPSGSVEIKAEAFNAAGRSIGASDVSTVSVAPGKTSSCELTVKEHLGKGNITVSGFVPDKYAQIEVRLVRNGKTVEYGSLVNGNNVVFSLDNGIYEVHFFSGDTEVALMETVRIVKDCNESLVLTEDSYMFGFISFTLGAGNPVIEDLNHYGITIDEGSEITPVTAEQLATVRPVKPGKHNVVVKGYTADNKYLANASFTLNVEKNKTAVGKIVLTENTGNGNAVITVTSAADFTDFKVIATSGSGSREPVSLVKDPQSNIWKCELSLPQDFYSLEFKDGETSLKTIENIRVIEAYDTVVNAEVADSWKVDVSIVDTIAKTPVITFNPTELTAHAGDAVTVTATVENIADYSIEWRFDNEIVPGQSGLVFSCPVPENSYVGKHVLTMFIRKGDTVWSENLNVTVNAPKKAFAPSFVNAVPKAMTRGLHSLEGPYKYFPDIEIACSVMRDMPLMTSLRAMSNAEMSFDFSSIPASFYAYDQRLRLQVIKTPEGMYITPCRVNDDGIFMRYELLQEVKRGDVVTDDVVGYLDYYYCWDTGTFSYRQYWVNTMEMEFGLTEPNRHNGYMLLEMTDVPLNMETGDYAYGQLELVDGVMQQRKDIVHDTLFLGDNSNSNNDGVLDHHITYVRATPILKSESGILHSRINGSSLTCTGFTPWTEVPGFNAIATKYDNGVGKITVGNMDNFGIDFVQDINEYLYENGKLVTSTDMRRSDYRGYTYKSFEEFNSHSLQKKNMHADVYKYHNGESMADNEVSFNCNTKTGVTEFYLHGPATYAIAMLDYSDMNRVRHYFTSNYDFKDFPAPETESALAHWYSCCYGTETWDEQNEENPEAPIPTGKKPQYEYIRQYHYQHLKKCGITDENYLENELYFTDLYMKIRRVYTVTGKAPVVDGRDPVEYRTYLNDFITTNLKEEGISIPEYPAGEIEKTYRY